MGVEGTTNQLSGVRPPRSHVCEWQRLGEVAVLKRKQAFRELDAAHIAIDGIPPCLAYKVQLAAAPAVEC